MTSTPDTAPRRRAFVRPLAVVCTAAVAAGALSACGTPGAAPSKAAPSTGAVSTAIPTEKVTLSILTSDESPTSKALTDAFTKKHPNVTIDYRFTAYDSYNTSLGLALNSENAPDLALLNLLGNTAKSGQIRALDPYVDAYGWDKTVPKSQLDQWRSDGKGSQLGNGKLWAAPAGFSLVGVYYNKQIASKLGISGPPKTLGEFEGQLAKAKAAGQLPIQVSNLDGHSSFVFQALVNQFQKPLYSTAWAFGLPTATLENEAGTQAAEKLADWAKKGYLPEGANGVDNAGAVAAFTKGQGLFMFDGNWDAGAVDKAMPQGTGFFTLPGTVPGAPAAGVGTSLAYAISAKAKNPDLAAAFLDFLGSPEAGQIQLDNGFMPVSQDPSIKAQKGSVRADFVTAWKKVGESNGLTPYFNNATPTMNDVLTSQGQQLIAGKTSPGAYLKAVQAEWDKGQK
ncbi:ABC transporter substrate-binding protein [Streptomyces sp. NPDC014861]|uniref:ABC transporter substrate-binding protein n=1 Tax=Streptomyces sp. NPDC014861 TaxID=3364923 RepID=UPI003702EFAD